MYTEPDGPVNQREALSGEVENYGEEEPRLGEPDQPENSPPPERESRFVRNLLIELGIMWKKLREAAGQIV